MPEFATGGIIDGPLDLHLDNGYIVNRAAAEAIGDGLLKLVNDRESHGPDCLECSGWPHLDDESES